MLTPVVSVRASPEDAALIRKVAARLRKDPGFRLSLEILLRANEKRGGPSRPRPNRGAFESEAAALAVVLDRLVATLRPAAVYLFGSRARGTARPDSDFDLLVVLPDGEDPCYRRAYEPLLGLGVGCDVVPCTQSDFAEDAAIPGTICHAAATEGRVLYRIREGAGGRDAGPRETELNPPK